MHGDKLTCRCVISDTNMCTSLRLITALTMTSMATALPSFEAHIIVSAGTSFFVSPLHHHARPLYCVCGAIHSRSHLLSSNIVDHPVSACACPVTSNISRHKALDRLQVPYWTSDGNSRPETLLLIQFCNLLHIAAMGT